MIILKKRKCFIGLPIRLTVYSIVEENGAYYLEVKRGLFNQNRIQISLYKLNDVCVRRNLLDLVFCVGYVYNVNPSLEIGKIHGCKKFQKLLEELSLKDRERVDMSYVQNVIT